MILILIATVLGSRYFSDWYDNIGRCGLSGMYKWYSCANTKSPTWCSSIITRFIPSHLNPFLLTLLAYISGGIQSEDTLQSVTITSGPSQA